jgi:2'-5' RNA ligase
MKKYAIELVFDEESQNKINKIREMLSSNGVHDEAVPTNHVSIADFETDDLDELKLKVKEFADSIHKFKLNLVTAGTFMTKENVIFLQPVMTEKLMNVHKMFLDSMKDFDGKANEYYNHNKWVPHCTIAIRLSDEELIKGFETLKSISFLPIEVTVDKIDILNYPAPYVQEYVVDIKD